MKILYLLILISVLPTSSYAQTSKKTGVKSKQKAIVNLDVDTIYKVSCVKWLDRGNGLVNKEDIAISLKVNKAKDKLTTDIPIIDGLQTTFKIFIRKEYEFTGIPAMVYGEKAVDMYLLNESNGKRINIMVSDKLIIKVD